MKVMIDGKLYDSLTTPILIVFDENEQSIFNMKRFVSAPPSSTVDERQKLLDTDIKEVLRNEIKEFLSEYGRSIHEQGD